MNYTYIYRYSYSEKKQGKKADILKYAEKHDLYILEEKNGNFVLARNASAVVYERDEENNSRIVRETNPFPYILQVHPEYQKVTEGRVKILVDSLNQGYTNFDDVCKAAEHN